MLESLRKKLGILNKTKEHWEETKQYIQVNLGKFIVSIITSTYTYRIHFRPREKHLSAQHTSFLLFTAKNNQLPQHYRPKLTKVRKKLRRSLRSYTGSFGRRKKLD